jgi:type VII secretion-associated serine protease mycosin
MRLKGRLWGWAIALALASWILATVPAPPAHADATRSAQWFLSYLHVAEAQKISTGAGVTVAVIDTGVDANHADLRGSILQGFDVVPGETGNGWHDPNGHGTNMAGLIVAHGHDGSGALGIAPSTKVLPIRALDASSNLQGGDPVASAIDLAVQRHAQVISISAASGPSDTLQPAVERAIAADIVVVAAAGNTPGDLEVDLPARIPGVVAVAAIDHNGDRAATSVTGPEIALAAPGVEIVSTNNDGRYSVGTGTSGATAIVAGAVALVRSKFPSMPATEVIHRLTATAIDKGPPGRDDQYGYGVLNILGALTANVPPLTPTPDATSQPATPEASPPPLGATEPPNSAPPVVAIALGIAVVTVVLLLGVALLRRASRRA